MAKTSLRNAPKFRLACRDLGLPAPYLAGHLELLWQTAFELATDGEPTFSREEIEVAAEWIGDDGRLVDVLVARRFLDEAGDDQYRIHNFDRHCPEYVRKRIRRAQESAQKDGNGGKRRTTADNGGQNQPVSGQRQTMADNGGKCLPTKPNQTQPNQTKPNRAEPDQDKQNATDPRQEEPIQSQTDPMAGMFSADLHDWIDESWELYARACKLSCGRVNGTRQGWKLAVQRHNPSPDLRVIVIDDLERRAALYERSKRGDHPAMPGPRRYWEEAYWEQELPDPTGPDAVAAEAVRILNDPNDPWAQVVALEQKRLEAK